MQSMKRIRYLEYFPSDGVGLLKGTVSKNQDWYLSNGLKRELKLPEPKTSSVQAELVHLELDTSAGVLENDIENSILLYRAFQDLTPHQASDERIWCCLCHTAYRSYVRARWLHNVRQTNIEKNIANHYFVNGTRGLRRDNGISRLWWLGYIAHKVDTESPVRVLQVIHRTADTRLNLIDRPSIFSNVRLLRAIYKSMESFWDEDILFLRENFRSWIISLNRWGGVLVLDSLSDVALENFLNEEAMKVLNKN